MQTRPLSLPLGLSPMGFGAALLAGCPRFSIVGNLIIRGVPANITTFTLRYSPIEVDLVPDRHNEVTPE